MRVLSNAFLSQAEITQIDRWKYGPLEIHQVHAPNDGRDTEFTARVCDWNRKQSSGFAREKDELEYVQKLGLATGNNPNQVLAPTCLGYTELHGMLGSLLPEKTLIAHGIERPRPNFWLWPCVETPSCLNDDNLLRYTDQKRYIIVANHLTKLVREIPTAFDNWIWSRLVKHKRFAKKNFQIDSHCAWFREIYGFG
ncbi:MAG TPA: hypothetical protein VG711_11815 [Phycisphaerales bacterium]|nr:hypothetical protein [Phycisphaerales bacterium]